VVQGIIGIIEIDEFVDVAFHGVAPRAVIVAQILKASQRVAECREETVGRFAGLQVGIRRRLPGAG
jgi:hypothetical protein